MSSDIVRQFPRPSTAWFTEARLGMFIHWGLYSMPARHEWVRNNERTSVAEYQKYFDRFYPDLYDPREWARLARQSGMRYAVLTAKHHEGFCLWDSAHTEYKATRTPWGQDLVKPFIEAFRAEGLRVGLYYSLLDWHHPDYTVDRHHPMRDNPAERARNEGRDLRRYAAYMRHQVEELLTRFGPIDIVWYDFSFPGADGKGRADWESEQLYELTRRLAPEVLIDNRLDLPGAGDFATPEQFQPDRPLVDAEGRPVVWEACQTFSGSWGYHRDEMTWKSVPQLLWMLIDGVSKGGNLLLNVGPTARGEFDHRARERLLGLGAWMRLHQRAIYGCGAAPAEWPCPADCRYTFHAGQRRLYVHVLNWPFKHLHLPQLAGKVAYAQLLHDASEVKFTENENLNVHQEEAACAPGGNLVLHLPVVKPAVEVPVVELFLR